MSPRPPRSRRVVASCCAALAVLLCPRGARALTLLEESLSLDGGSAAPAVVVALAAAPKDPDASLDFDLLGEPPAVKAVDDPAMRLRRSMLKVHQGVGLALVGLELATTVVGQLNYSDKYGSNAPVTARYELTHAGLAFTTLGVFAVNGAIALLAPRPARKASRGFDRVTLHKIGMALAATGMAAQGIIGVHTDRREGYLDQARYARTHLVIGYATLAAFGVAVGALVF